jgi:hypothetical protein
MSPEAVLLAFLVLIIVLIILLPMVTRKKEGFANTSGFTYFDNFIKNPAGYNDESAKKYNVFSSVQDVTVRNYANAETNAKIDEASVKLRNALRTSEIAVDPTSYTFEGVKPNTPALSLAPQNQIVEEAKKCEALNNRDNCSALDDRKYANCGICVKDRSTMFKHANDKNKIGGLLVLPEDRRSAVAAHGGKTGPVQYTATVGNCPPNYLFVDAAACKKEVNRLDCLEAGKNGGFNGGRTSEGKDVVKSKCAAVPAAGDLFVYDPKNRKFDINLRVLAPLGTGLTKVYVENSNGTVQLGSASSDRPGVEFVVPVKNVQEGQQVLIRVFQEAPHRRKGKAEVFQYKSNLNGGNEPQYNQTIATSAAVCQRIGARVATDAELQQAWTDGAQACSCGNTTSSCVFPSQTSKNGCGSNGINQCGTDPRGWNSGRGHSWCYGLKPANSTGGEIYGESLPWFSPYESSSPDQSELPQQWSKHGADYQVPGVRAVILQWEFVDDSRRMAQPFEPSITSINGLGPNNTSSEGLKTFKTLRRFGTFKSSSLISGPKPVDSSPFVTSQFWIWSNKANDQKVTFEAKIPGTFMKPYYAEDDFDARRGQLLTDKSTEQLLQVSPCLKEGQVAGKYSMACLSNLYAGSGGDLVNGKLATVGLVDPYDGSTGKGLADLNKLGDMDAISAYLDNQYSIATTGVDGDGNKVGGDDPDAHAKAINTAAQLLFGFDITTPCEDVQEDKQGNIVIVPKTPPVDKKCLTWLWQNTGSDKNMDETDPTRRTAPHKGGILNTYRTIKDRYSGLRNGEATPLQRKASPFQACTMDGTMAPKTKAAIDKVNSQKYGEGANKFNSIAAIQTTYDFYHYQANYLPDSSDPDTMAKKEKAVERCYGIKKAADKVSPPCNALPTSYKPKQNVILGNVDMTGDYVLSFTITPTGLEGNWANIIRFQQAPGGLGDCCNLGHRSPAIWFFPGAFGFHVRVGDRTDGNWGINTDVVPAGQPCNFKLECRDRSVKVTVNGKVYQETQPTSRFAGKMVVYGSDPWYVAANANVTNLKYENLTVNAKVLGPIGMGPWGYASQFADKGAQWIWDEQGAASNATVGKTIYFSKELNVSSTTRVTIHCISDDGGQLFVNDDVKGSIAGGGWGTTNYTKLVVDLKSGTNTIKISSINGGGPAGLVASIIRSDGAVLAHTDGTWTVSY